MERNIQIYNFHQSLLLSWAKIAILRSPGSAKQVALLKGQLFPLQRVGRPSENNLK